jgi:hypothetical protein
MVLELYTAALSGARRFLMAAQSPEMLDLAQTRGKAGKVEGVRAFRKLCQPMATSNTKHRL